MTFAERIQNCTGRSEVAEDIAECVLLTLDRNGYATRQCEEKPEDELAELYYSSTDLSRRHILLSRISGPVSETINATYIGIAYDHGIESDSRGISCDEFNVDNYSDENCGWNYTLKDLGQEYFPRYVLMPECHGKKEGDVGMGEFYTKESYASRLIVLKLQRTSCEADLSEKWIPCDIPCTEVTLACVCQSQT